MKFKKKWLAMLMVLTMVLSLALTGCNKSNDNDENFTTLKNPTTISVTFTLSDIAWDANQGEDET